MEQAFDRRTKTVTASVIGLTYIRNNNGSIFNLPKTENLLERPRKRGCCLHRELMVVKEGHGSQAQNRLWGAKPGQSYTMTNQATHGIAYHENSAADTNALPHYSHIKQVTDRRLSPV